jgi:hypothetical protein
MKQLPSGIFPVTLKPVNQPVRKESIEDEPPPSGIFPVALKPVNQPVRKESLEGERPPPASRQVRLRSLDRFSLPPPSTDSPGETPELSELIVAEKIKLFSQKK